MFTRPNLRLLPSPAALRRPPASVVAAFLFAAFVVIASFVMSLRGVAEVASSSEAARTRFALIGRLEETLDALLDAERSAHDVVFVGNGGALPSYRRAVQRLDRELDRSRALPIDPGQVAELDRLREIVTERRAALHRAIAAIAAEGSLPGLQLDFVRDGVALRERARSFLADMRRSTVARLEEGDEESRTRLRDTIAGLAAASASLLLLLVLMYLRVTSDVAARRTSAAELRRRLHQQEAVAELGDAALRSATPAELAASAARGVGEALDVELVEVMRLDPERQVLALMAGIGWNRDEFEVGVSDGSQAGYTLGAREPVLVEDLQREQRFRGAPVLHEHGVVSGITVAIEGHREPWGVLGVHCRERRAFARHDVHFLAAVANLLGAAFDRARSEAEQLHLAEEGRDAREATLRSEQRFRRLFESSVDAIVVLDDAGKFLDANVAACRTFGVPRERLLEADVGMIRVACGRSAKELFGDYLGGRQTGEIPVLRPDGSEVVIDYAASTIEPGLHVAILRDVTSRRRTERHNKVLLDVARDVGGSLDRDEILRRIQNRLLTALPCDALVAWYWDPEVEVYRLISHAGIPESLRPAAEAIVFRANEPFDGRLHEAPVVLDDMARQSSLPREMWEPFGITALAAVQFRVRDRHVGSLCALHRGSGRRFSAEDVELLAAVAAQLSIVLEAAELHEAEVETAKIAGERARFSQELIASLHTEAFLDRLCRVAADLLDADTGHFLARSPEKDDFVAMGSHGIEAHARQAAAALEIPSASLVELLRLLERDDVAQVEHAPPGLDPDPLRGPTTQLCIALRRGQEILGLLLLGRRGRTAPFEMREKILGRSIAHVASLALEHARVVDQLRRSDEMKTTLLGVFSHEVRTPLNVVIGYHDMLLDGDFGPLSPDQDEALRRANGSARQLCRLIENALDVSNFDANRISLDLRPTSVPLLLGAIDAETYLVRESTGVPLELSFGPALPEVRTDPEKLSAAVKNLIANAFAHTRAGVVRVSARAVDGGIEIAVSDTGSGMAPERLEKLFQRFHCVGDRGDDGNGHGKANGIGVGLYVAHRLIGALGGSIAVDSAIGKGSTFRVFVPDGGKWAPARDARMATRVASHRRHALVAMQGGVGS